MASVKAILRSSKIKANGEIPICIRISIKGKTAFKFIGHSVKKEEWNDKLGEVRRSNPLANSINALIAKKLKDVKAAVANTEVNEKPITLSDLKNVVKNESAISFLEYATRHLNSISKIGTYNRVNTVITKLKDYHNDDDLYFHQIDLRFLNRYEAYLRDELKNKTNTVHANLKVLRMLFNKATSEELINIDSNPFLKKKLKTEKVNRDYLTSEEIEAIKNVELIADSKIEHHRNAFLFAIYAGGIRISDLLTLKWENIIGDHISYKVRKTGLQFRLILVDKAKEIIQKYKVNEEMNPDDFVFPFLNNSIDYQNNPKKLHNEISSKTAHTNKNIKIIVERAGIKKKISFHISRHTFAIKCLNNEMGIEYVSKALGHQDLKTTQIYAKVLDEGLDKAMLASNK